MKYIAGIDLGGTNIKALLMDEKFAVKCRKSVPTPYLQPPKATFDAIIGEIEDMLAESGLGKGDLLGIGIGVPGLTDCRTNITYSVAFLKWKDTDVGKPLHDHFGVPVYAENDGNVNALGEMYYGAGRGYKDIVLLTLGTGLGCGIICDGKLLRGSKYVSGESGHIIIEKDGEQCACGKRGCFEACCSARAMARDARRFALEHEDSLLWDYCGGDLRKVDGQMIDRGYDAGDPACLQTMQLYTTRLAVGINSLINVLNPEIVIIGGGVSRSGERILAPTRKLVEQNLMHPIQKCEIVAGELYTDAGVMGACSLVAQGQGLDFNN